MSVDQGTGGPSVDFTETDLPTLSEQFVKTWNYQVYLACNQGFTIIPEPGNEVLAQAVLLS